MKRTSDTGHSCVWTTVLDDTSINFSPPRFEAGGWMHWPDNEDYSLQFMRVLGSAQEGSSTISECFLTFVGFFLFETIKQLPIHPIQYALVGLALAIFFLLLLSLSEHIAFGLAYLVAALACIGLIGYYVGHVLRSRTRGFGFAAMLGLLYAALYGLLMSEDNALVLGAGLLFVVLAAIMVATRRVDSYQVASRVGTQAPPTWL